MKLWMYRIPATHDSYAVFSSKKKAERTWGKDAKDFHMSGITEVAVDSYYRKTLYYAKKRKNK